MRNLVAIVFFGLSGVACSSESDAASNPSGPCQPPNGAYLLHYVARPGGSCTTPPDSVAVISPDNMGGPDCTDLGTTDAADGCSSVVHLLCTVTGGTVELQGKLELNDNAAASMTALVTLKVVLDTGRSCTGTFDITYTKQ